MSTVTHIFESHKRIENGRIVSHDFVQRIAKLDYDMTGRRLTISILPTLSPKSATLVRDFNNTLYYVGDDPNFRFEIETWPDNNTIKGYLSLEQTGIWKFNILVHIKIGFGSN